MRDSRQQSGGRDPSRKPEIPHCARRSRFHSSLPREPRCDSRDEYRPRWFPHSFLSRPSSVLQPVLSASDSQRPCQCCLRTPAAPFGNRECRRRSSHEALSLTCSDLPFLSFSRVQPVPGFNGWFTFPLVPERLRRSRCFPLQSLPTGLIAGPPAWQPRTSRLLPVGCADGLLLDRHRRFAR